MGKHSTRVRVRRKIRLRKKQVVGIGETANKQLDRHIFRRWHNLKLSWRFALGWIGLLVILSLSVVFQTRALGTYYLHTKPVAGGVYTEGIVGNFSNANPIYATSEVDSAVSKLVFSSLLTYDTNNKLVGNLAESYEADARAINYTVRLKKNLTWHDGQPLTADDVVFTYRTIQNPDAKSPYLSSWTGVKIEKLNDYAVLFTLPGAYSPFPHSLTNGIIPKHILKDVAPEQLRSSGFNTKSPVGSGPFRWRGVTVEGNTTTGQTETVKLTKFDRYYNGVAKLDGIAIKTFQKDTDLLAAVNSKQIIAASGLSLTDKDIKSGLFENRYNLMSSNMLFLKNTSPILNDVKVRQALTKGTDVLNLTSNVGYSVLPVREPLLKNQVGYNPSYQQYSFNKAEAIALLDAAGWTLAPNEQIRTKNGQKLTLNFSYENSPEFSRIASALQKQWSDIGVDLVVDAIQAGPESKKLVDSHEYDVLLYGINIGPDPDVFPYWHSSQFDKLKAIRLNLSEYKSGVADLALESGRTRIDPALRAAKYKPFLEAWQKDAPAIGLYQPRYLNISNQQVYGSNSNTINVPSDRFNDVNMWMINTIRTADK